MAIVATQHPINVRMVKNLFRIAYDEDAQIFTVFIDSVKLTAGQLLTAGNVHFCRSMSPQAGEALVCNIRIAQYHSTHLCTLRVLEDMHNLAKTIYKHYSDICVCWLAYIPHIVNN